VTKAQLRPEREPPKLPLRRGMPLTIRDENIAYATNEMRVRSQLVTQRSAEGAPFMDIDVLAGLLHEYADLIDTLMYHGTRGWHTSGCRCDWCLEASSQYWRVANRRRKTPQKTRKQRREERATMWFADIEEGEEEL